MYKNLFKNILSLHTGIYRSFRLDCFFNISKCLRPHVNPVCADYLSDFICRRYSRFFTFEQTKKYKEGGGHYEKTN